MRKAFYILFCSVFLFPAKGQLMDSLGTLIRDKYSVDARLESRYSFIDNQVVSVSGARIGLAFQRKLRIGGGISWLKTDFPYEDPQATQDDFAFHRLRYLKFAYICYYVDFVFHKTKRWQLSVPIQAGFGLSWIQDRRNYSLTNKDRKYLLLLYEPGITAQFKVFKWAGLGADVAYRFSYNRNRLAARTLNSPTYSFKILFWFDQLYYDLYPESKLARRYGPAFW